MADVEFRILGPMEVVDGARRIDLPRGHGRALLAMLALHPGEVVDADRIVDGLWGERPPQTAGTVVQGLVSRLRRLLDPDRVRGAPSDLLRTVGQGYLLAAAPEDVDAERFSLLLTQVPREPPATRSVLLGKALSLWHGPALADFTYEPFAQRAISALEEMRIGALESRIEADLDLGRHREVVAELSDLVALHPFRERLRCLQMVALYRSGRQAESLDAYREARERLQEELGVEPGAELRDLQAAVLRQDPTLGLPTRPRVEPALPEGWLPRERRQVTALVLELAPATAPDADAELLAKAGAHAVAAATEVLRRHQARVEQVVGDVLVALFGLPLAHEDDPVRAVRAALEVREALARLPEDRPGAPRSIRAGLETGEVVVAGASDGQVDRASGPALTIAFQMQRRAGTGEVVVGGTARSLLGGSVVLMPREDGAWSATRVLAPRYARPRSDESLFGRAEELAALRAAYRRTVRTSTPSRRVVVGEAGIGKSRLVRELLALVDEEARVATGRCPAYGEGITFLPLREALLETAGPGGWSSLTSRADPADAEKVAQIIGLSPTPGNVHTGATALTRLVEDLAAERPLVLVLEDLHWAEDALLALVDLVHASARGPILLLCVGRPELLEERPAWARDALVLAALPREDMDGLVRDRARTRDSAALARVAEVAQGNPLYAEQLVAALADGRNEPLPRSLSSLLAARLDRLGPGERDLLRCASVIGETCRVAELHPLLPEGARAHVARHLATLERRRLVKLLPESGVAFRHVLLQQAAYRSMVNADRATLHEVYARWLRDRPTPPPDSDEVVGYHLEQAVSCRRTGGELQDPALAVEAGEHLARAGRRAVARLDQAAGRNLLSRARALLPEGSPAHSRVTQALSEVDLVLGRFAEAQELLLETARDAAERGDRSTETTARLEHARIQYIVGPDPVPLSEVRRTAEDAAAFFERTRDTSGVGRAIFLRALVHLRRGEMVEAEAALRTSLEHADRSGDPRERLATRWILAQVLCEGPWPVDECRDRLDALSLRGLEHPGLGLYSATLAAMQTRYDEARSLLGKARRVILEVNHAPRLLMFAVAARARVELLAGDLAVAEQRLRELLDLTRSGAEPDRVADAAARLGLVLLDRGGPVAEARGLAALSGESATAEGVVARTTALALAARLRSASGDHDEAVRLATEAATGAPPSMPDHAADLSTVLAAVQAAARRPGAARLSLDRARELYRVKGNLAALRRTEVLTRT